uniref:Menin n=1 Tax=Schistocephalus solidus TaxID=70667 RepID=A0A0X3PM36_SCHSO
MTLRSSNLASMRAWRRYFPLVSVESVTDLFEDIFQQCRISDDAWNSASEPNLAFISIILGYIETQLTLGSSSNAHVLPTVKSHGTAKSGTDLTVSHRRRPLQEPSTRSKRSNLRSSSPSLRKVDSPVASFSLETPPISEIPATPRSAQRCLSRDSSCESTAATPRSGTRTPVSLDFRNAQPPTRTTADSSISNTNNSELYENVPGSTVFPSLRFEEAEGLYQKFYSIIVNNSNIKSYVTKVPTEPGSHSLGSRKSLGQQPEDAPRTASRDLIRAVCSTLCSQLTSSRQREHLVHAQSIYSLLKTGLLDSFGLAFATVAACQLLGYADVHLALSEDHAWVEFGAAGQRETADVAVMPTFVDGQLGQSKNETDVTSEGSGNTRFRSSLSGPPEPYPSTGVGNSSATSKITTPYPPPIRMGHLCSSWLYLNGCPVVCKPALIAAAAAITAIQPCGLSRSVQSLQLQNPTASDFTPPASPASSAGTRPSRPGGRSAELGSTQSRHRSSGSAISSSETVSHELVRLKQSLLWVTLRAGLLSRYPLGLTNLADIEEGFPSSDGRRLSDLNGDWTAAADCYAPAGSELACFGKPSPSLPCVLEELVELRQPTDRGKEVQQPQHQPQQLLYPLKVENSLPLELLFRAVEINRSHYHNQHVYPYIYLANYLYRHGYVQDAMRYWAEAARVIGQYNHSSEDAEIYREFLDVATRIMPDIFKSVAMENRSCCEGPIVSDPVDGAYQPENILDSPLCLAYLLAFYDHLCLWEENSVVPVLHVGWVDKLMVSLTRFSAFARRNLTLEGTRSLPEKSSSSLASRSSRQTPASDVGAPGSPALSCSRISSPSLPPPSSAPPTKSMVRGTSIAHQQPSLLPSKCSSRHQFGEPPVSGDPLPPMQGSPAVPLVVVSDEPINAGGATHLDQSKSPFPPDGRTQPLTVLLPGAVAGFQGSETGSGPTISPALPSSLTSSTSSSAVSIFTAATLSHPHTEECDTKAHDNRLPLSDTLNSLHRSLSTTSEGCDVQQPAVTTAPDLHTDSCLGNAPAYKVRKLDAPVPAAPVIPSSLEDCKTRGAHMVDAPQENSTTTAAATEDLFSLDLEDVDLGVCIDASRQALISFLASGCEHRLLNPAFLLGQDATSPFLSPADQDNLDWDELLAEEKEAPQLPPAKVSHNKLEDLLFGVERPLLQSARGRRRRQQRDLSPGEATAAAVTVTYGLSVSEPGKQDLVGEDAAPPSSGTTTGSSEPRTSFSPASSCHFSPLNIMIEANSTELGKFPGANNPLDYLPSDDQPTTVNDSCRSYEQKEFTAEKTAMAMDLLAADATKEEAMVTVEGDAKPVADPTATTSILETEDFLHLLLNESHSGISSPAPFTITDMAPPTWETPAAPPTRSPDAPPTHSDHTTDVAQTGQLVPPSVCYSPLAVHLRLYSVKMSSIASLLSTPGRVNSSAIKLALTAQSQVRMRRRSATVSGSSTATAVISSPSVSSTSFWKSSIGGAAAVQPNALGGSDLWPAPPTR